MFYLGEWKQETSIKIEKTNERRHEERLLERQRIDDIEELRK